MWKADWILPVQQAFPYVLVLHCVGYVGRKMTGSLEMGVDELKVWTEEFGLVNYLLHLEKTSKH